MNGTAVINKLSTWALTSSSILKKITDPIARLLTFSLADDIIYPAKTVSASLDKGALSVAYGRRFFSRMKILGIREYSFEGRYPQPEVFASSLSLAINDLGATNADVTLSIPKAWTIISTTEFPVTVKENLSDVIAYELDRITPFNAGNAFYDFRVLKEKDEKLSILVVAVKADVIQPYIDALREKGISVSRVTANISGIETLCRFIGMKRDIVFLELRKDGYEGALFLDTEISNVLSGNFSTDDERSHVDVVVKEVTPLMDTIKSSGKEPHIMVHLRETSPGLKELLKAQVQQPVSFLNETDIKLKQPASEKGIPYAALGGALESLWPKANGLNLLTKGLHETAKAPKFLTAILLLIILGLWIVYLVAPLQIEEKRLQEIDRQIMSRKEEVKKVETLKKEIEALEGEIATINNFKENRRMSLDILKELTAILPKIVWLSRVRVSETNVDLEGYASSATGLLSKLEASSFFKKVEFSSPTFRDTRMNADRFNIKMEIEGVQTDLQQTEEETDGEEEQ
ncbi:MAG: PilN domain-containing protein [Nitrospirota bacterium]